MRYPKDIAGFVNQAYEGPAEEASTRPETDVEPSTHINSQDNHRKRAQWGHGLEFLMSCIAMSVGLGNIWRFPFTAYENGGGAFLIPYVIVLFVVGRPLYYMDMALGQFSSCNSIKMFGRLAPAVKGVGYIQTFAAAIVATYYCALVAVILFYLISSFTAHLPWINCHEEWETENALKNISCIVASEKSRPNISNAMSSSELWFTREVLKENINIEDGIGLPDWKLTLCLLFGWVCTYLVSIKGIHSAGKAAYFLALFPYVIMIIILIRAVTLEGSAVGILYFVTPNWEKIFSANVWFHAVTQCFYSLNVGGGAIIMYASYNDFNYNIYRDTLIITTLDTLTSLLAGFTTFGILGNLAHELNVDVEDVISSGGIGLVFISYPEAIAKFEDVPWIFAILFFLMLFILGVGSLMALHNVVNTVITDNLKLHHNKSWMVSAATAMVGFLAGIIYTTPAGQVILTIVDYFTGTFIVFMVGVLETVAVVWWYGVENFCNDLEYMLKKKVSVFWRITWGIITPSLLLIIFVYFLATIPRLSYGHHRIPDIALICGWMLPVIAVILIMYCIFESIYKNRELGFPQMISEAFSTRNWGPRSEEEKKKWCEFKQQKLDEVSGQSKSWLKHKLHFFLGR